MKLLVLTALMGATLSNVSANITAQHSDTNSVAHTHLADKKSAELTSQISLHQWSVDVVWAQYERAVADIKNKPGSVSHLLAQMNRFITYYQADIAEGVRVEASKEAIADIRKLYGKKIAKQRDVETDQITRLQALLETELEKEEEAFNALKRNYENYVNAQTEPLIRSMERQFAQSSARMEALKGAEVLALL